MSIDTKLPLVSIEEIITALRNQIKPSDLPWAEENERALYNFASDLTGLSTDRICELMDDQAADEMLKRIQSGTDLYNPEKKLYVFCYNEEGSICVYHIDNDRAAELAKEAKEAGEYWGALLGPGGAIYDDPESTYYRAEQGSNIDWCRDEYGGEWIDTNKYLDTLPKKDDAAVPEAGRYKVICRIKHPARPTEITIKFVRKTDSINKAISEARSYKLSETDAAEYAAELGEGFEMHMEVQAEGKTIFWRDNNGTEMFL